MRLTKIRKYSWLFILASSLIITSCGEDNDNGGNNGNNNGDNNNGNNNGNNNNPSGKTQTKTVCSCELDDNDCINKCIRTVCSCKESDSIENCAGQCQTAGSCNIVSTDMGGGGFNPMDPSSWGNMQIKVSVTIKDQLACMEKALKECALQQS